MNIIKIDTNGVISEHELNKADVLGCLYNLINCDYIEVVKPMMLYAKHGCWSEPINGKPGKAVCMIVDEEGLLNHKPENFYATTLYGNPMIRVFGLKIVGDVVFVGLEETEDGVDICGIEACEYNRLLESFKKELEG